MYKNKQLLSIFLLSFIVLLLVSCRKSDETISEKVTFTAEVISLEDDTLLVRPDDHTWEDVDYSQMYVPLDTTIVDVNGNLKNSSDLFPGNRVQITYDGETDHSDPALIMNCYEIMILE